MTSDYSLSVWIENFGVVPLLLLAAFLFLPILVFLIALLIFVTLVLDTIILSLSNSCSIIRGDYKIMAKIVKAFSLFTPLLSLTMTLQVKADIASPNKINDFQVITITKGEIFEQKTNNLSHFTVGNKEILKVKYRPKDKSFLIKGSKLGQSEVTWWSKKGKKKVISIYVLSKRDSLKAAKYFNLLNNSGLDVFLNGPVIHIKGEIKEEGQYLIIKKILEENPKNLLINAFLENKFKKSIVTKVYQYFLGSGIHNFFCEFKDIKLYCNIDFEENLSKEQKKFLTDNYIIQIINNEIIKNKNFDISLKIILFETSNNNNLSLGLNEISGKTSQILDNDLSIENFNNSWFFKEKDIKITTIAEPKLTLILDEKSGIQLGSEIPITQSTDQKKYTEWKFAGLKADFLLKKINNLFYLKLNTEFTGPDTGNISGTKNYSTIEVKKNRIIKFFEIKYQTNGQAKNSIPVVNKIPVLGQLFSHNDLNYRYKKVEAYLTIKRRKIGNN